MKCKDSNFWIGLGIGSVAGALAYHFSRTEKAKKLEDAICRAIHKANGRSIARWHQSSRQDGP